MKVTGLKRRPYLQGRSGGGMRLSHSDSMQWLTDEVRDYDRAVIAGAACSRYSWRCPVHALA